jgi:competence protein ComEA
MNFRPLLMTFAAAILSTSVAVAQTTPVPNQSDEPKVTHKMSPQEKSKTNANSGPVDLNKASKEELAALPGVGPSYAQKIVDARPFVDKNQLLGKKILPGSTYERIKDRITVSPVK